MLDAQQTFPADLRYAPAAEISVRLCKNVRLLKSKTSDAIGIGINEISFRSLLRALGRLPSAMVGKNKYNLMNDDAFASFEYKGVMFEIHTPLSDYWIDKPENCPASVFEELTNYLEQLKVRWWHRLI